MMVGKDIGSSSDQYIPLQEGYAMAESVLFWSPGDGWLERQTVTLK